MKLHTQILIGLAAGACLGLAANLGDSAALTAIATGMEPLGTFFIRVIGMVVVPVVVGSLLVGVASLGDVGRVGRIGARSIGFFVVTTIIAAAIGLAAAALLQPGSGIDPQVQRQLLAQFGTDAASASQNAGARQPSLIDMLLAVPRNPMAAAAEGDLLSLIFVTLIFGTAAGLLTGDRRRSFLGFFEAINQISLTVINWAMRLAPFAVFALISAVVARAGLDVLGSLVQFCLVVVLGELVYVLAVLAPVVRFLVGMNPLVFLRRIAKVPLVAFSTSSSSATLPVNMETAETELGISKTVVGFVLPLAAATYKSGSALYKAVAVMFIAEVYGFPLGVPQLISIVFAATVSAISGAGVPGSGMVTILIVLNAAGLGPQAAAGVALVVGVDRILDMVRTSVNATAQAVAGAYIARGEGEVLSSRAAAVRATPVQEPELVPAGAESASPRTDL